MDAPTWRRFLLDQGQVETLFREADRHKVLRFLEATDSHTLSAHATELTPP